MSKDFLRIVLSGIGGAALGILTVGTQASWLIGNSFNPFGAFVNIVGCVAITTCVRILLR